MKDLFEIIPPDVCMDDFCHPERYRIWEDEVATPALQNLGYREVTWRTGEADSFGPLSRVGTAYLNGIPVKFVYG